MNFYTYKIVNAACHRVPRLLINVDIFSTLVCNIPVYSCVHNLGCVFKSLLWSTLVTLVWSLTCIKFKCLLMFCLLIIKTTF